MSHFFSTCNAGLKQCRAWYNTVGSSPVAYAPQYRITSPLIERAFTTFGPRASHKFYDAAL